MIGFGGYPATTISSIIFAEEFSSGLRQRLTVINYLTGTIAAFLLPILSLLFRGNWRQIMAYGVALPAVVAALGCP